MKATLLVLLTASALGQAQDRRRVVTSVAQRPAWATAVARFTWVTKRGGAGSGSAVLVSRDLAMTAYHCVQDWTGRGLLRFGLTGKEAAVRRTAVAVVDSSAAGDWAILRLDRPVASIKPLVPAKKKLRAYDTKHMLLAGYSCDPGNGRGGRFLSYDDGCRAKKVRSDAGRILTDALCFRGASGGPAFVRDKDGGAYHWVGLVQGNINASDKKSIVTYVVYQSVYAAALRRATDARIK